MAPAKPRKNAQDKQDELQKKNLLEELKNHQRRHYYSSKSIFDDTDIEIKEDDDSDQENDDYEDCDTKALKIEIEKIKKERAEDKLLLELSLRGNKMIEVKEDGLLGENPLLYNLTNSFSVKRKWDDDVTFKNQGCGEAKTTKRFVNDTIRNDFHRKFIHRYMSEKLNC